LPACVQLWLGLWLGLRDEETEGALILLTTKVNGSVSPDSELLDYMEAVATIGGLAFFSLPRGAARLPIQDPALLARPISMWSRPDSVSIYSHRRGLAGRTASRKRVVF
jgi:hypothetical protein